MTGPEHYLAAERLIERSAKASDVDHARHLDAVAQVHAVLAHAAAAALGCLGEMSEADRRGWREAAFSPVPPTNPAQPSVWGWLSRSGGARRGGTPMP